MGAGPLPIAKKPNV